MRKSRRKRLGQQYRPREVHGQNIGGFGDWSRMAPGERKMVLVRWAELIEQHAEELALLETLDVGKPISDTLSVDVPSAVRTIRWSGEAIDKVYEEIAKKKKNKERKIFGNNRFLFFK